MVLLLPRITREWLSAKAVFRNFCESALFLNHRGSRGSWKAAFSKCAQRKGCSFAVIHPQLQVWNETWDIFLHSCMLFLPFLNILCYTWNLPKKKKKKKERLQSCYPRAIRQSWADSALIVDKCLLKKVFLHGSSDLEALPLFKVT